MHALIYFVAAGEEEGEALATVEECVMKWTTERGVDYYHPSRRKPRPSGRG